MTHVPPTPLSKLQEAREIGLEAGLHHVYLGNVHGGADTVCHYCGGVLIRRSAYKILENRMLAGGRCPDCGFKVSGIGMGSNQKTAKDNEQE